MDKTDYPKEITRKNLAPLLDEAQKAKSKARNVLVSTVIGYTIVSLLLFPVIFYLSGQAVLISYTPETMPSEIEIVVATMLLGSVAYLTFLYFFIIFLEKALKWIFKLNYVEWIFYQSLLIANNLKKNTKQSAIKEVNGFTDALFRYQRDYFDNKSLWYKPEIHKIQAGKVEIKRMILFSTANLSDMFEIFGLSLLNGNHPEAYSNLHKIIDEARKFGKMEGWFERISGKFSNVELLLTVASLIITIIINVLTIMSLSASG